MVIEGVEVTTNLPDLTIWEAARYVEYVKARVNAPIALIDVRASSDGTVDVSYEARWQRFERIRRITGYLTGDLSSWNDAKKVEERERVKHDDKIL